MKTGIRILLLFIFTVCFSPRNFSQHPLEKEIYSIIKDRNAYVGVAVGLPGEPPVLINNDSFYPTYSVFKFHLALAVLHHLDSLGLPLNTGIFVRKADLLPDTYSPLRDSRPEGNFEMTAEELLRYTVSLSDNNTCDILLRYIGGPERVQSYMDRCGIKGVVISADEAMMHSRVENQFLNRTTPLSAVHVLELFLRGNLFSAPYQEFLEKAMTETVTGADKLRAGLPENVTLGHKTGSSSRDEQGLKLGDNDIGFVLLPDGRRYTVAVFITRSVEDDKTNALITAQISRAVYDYVWQR